jgi:hypothetical protein
LDIISNFASLLLNLQFLHPRSCYGLYLPELLQVLLHLGDFLQDFLVVRNDLALEFIEIVGDVLGKEGKYVGMIVQVVSC